MKKGCLIAAGAGVALVLLIVGLAFLGTSNVAGAADEFLGRLRDGKTQEAYSLTSAGFRRETGEAAFGRFAHRYGLDRIESWSKTHRSVSGDHGKVSGTLSLKGGGEVAYELTLVHEQGQWRVQGINATPGTGVLVKEPVPEAAELKRLVRTTLLEFNDAVKAKDFTRFRETCTEAFRREFDAEKLREAFADYLKADLDISPIAALEPAFDGQPKVDEEEVLSIEGAYPTTPAKVYFRVRYGFESGGWKPMGLSVQVKE